ncbi:MAG: oligosaccharyl transferase, archaeosortase A system-associated [Patescibacteria group bacterium]
MNRETLQTLALLLLFTTIALIIRLIPMTTGAGILGNDPWYNLRQIEIITANFPAYPWFDPMTQYPYGNVIHWGPVFVQLIAGLCLLTGMTARPDLLLVASLVPPLMAAIMVPLLYRIGTLLADRLTGLLAAGFMAIVSGQYFYRSLFGFVDHHIAEVLVSTLFILGYLLAIAKTRSPSTDPEPLKTRILGLKPLTLISLLTGTIYAVGVGIMPTMILFALIVALFTLVYAIWQTISKHPDTRILEIAAANTLIFGTATVIMALLGYAQEPTLALSRMGVGHLYACLALIAGSWILALAVTARTKYPARTILPALLLLALAGTALIALVSPDLTTALTTNANTFFSGTSLTETVGEARPWTLIEAWYSFGIGLLLLVGGAILLWQKAHTRPDHLFALVWTAVIVASTVQHMRYEYYCAVCIAITSALFIAALINKGRHHLSKKNNSGLPLLLMAALFAFLFIVGSVQADTAIATGIRGLHPDWPASLAWLEQNTPDPGIDYLRIYRADTFTYPDESYGVMSWWDYGHFITFLGKRIPVANPFQHGVSGPTGAAAYMVSQTEDESTAILDALNAKYIITESTLPTTKFWAITTWANETAGLAPYASPSGPTPAYYTTTLVRLHLFDGTRIAFDNPAIPPVPALQHYRLIYESDTGLVKIFEYVPGAIIDAEEDGLPLALEVTTSRNRTFTYEQTSKDGRWVVPYPGTYRSESGEISVTDDDIRAGRHITPSLPMEKSVG